MATLFGVVMRPDVLQGTSAGPIAAPGPTTCPPRLLSQREDSVQAESSCAVIGKS